MKCVLCREVSWSMAMKFLFWGLALSTITFNVWVFEYILPLAGVVLMMLGLRILRRENIWFAGCLYVTIVQLAYCMLNIILNTTIYRLEDFNALLPMIFSVVLLLVLFFCLFKAFRVLGQKAELSAHTGGMIALVAWYLVICVLTVLQYTGFIIAVILLVAYVFIMRELFSMISELDEIGYCVRTARVLIPDIGISAAVIALTALGMMCGYLFFDSYNMKWEPAAETESAEAVQIKERLISLGFPEDVLEDLTEEDIVACRDASRVIIWEAEYSSDDGERIENGTEDMNDGDDGEGALYITDIGVELPGNTGRWKLFHHFCWRVNPGFYGTEVIQLIPTYSHEGWDQDSEITGQVMYDVDGKVYYAPYIFSDSENNTQNDDGILSLMGQHNSDIFAEFSMPNEGEKHRGYISYSIIAQWSDECLVDSWFEYTHQRSWRQYPVMTALEKIRSGMLTDRDVFVRIQNALQFAPVDETEE